MATRKELKEQIREILAEDFVGPPLPEPINAPYGFDDPMKPVSRRNMDPHEWLAHMTPKTVSPGNRETRDLQRSIHPAAGYYGKHPVGVGGPEGSREWHPGRVETPLRPADQFYPPPTISNEEQEMIDANRRALVDEIVKALREDKKRGE